jgi:hypothetical protein
MISGENVFRFELLLVVAKAQRKGVARIISQPRLRGGDWVGREFIAQSEPSGTTRGGI